MLRRRGKDQKKKKKKKEREREESFFRENHPSYLHTNAFKMSQVCTPALHRLSDQVRRCVAKAKRTPARLLVSLDLFFECDSFATACGSPNLSLASLSSPIVREASEAAMKALSACEEQVQAHNTKSVPHDGTVHAVTSNTVATVRRCVEYTTALESLLPVYFADRQIALENQSHHHHSAGGNAVGQYLRRISTALEGNLAKKAESYPREALRWIFLLNNHRFREEKKKRKKKKKKEK